MRSKHIDPRGHVETQSQAVVACKRCPAVRLKDRDWPEPCPAASEAKQKAAASAG